LRIVEENREEHQRSTKEVAVTQAVAIETEEEPPKPTMATTDVAKCDGLPLKVYQDDFRPGRGNALQAAVASIFGMALAEVPNFVELPQGYEVAIQSFCHERGRVSVKLKLAGDDDTTIGENHERQLCVLRGKSPRGGFGHVVVAIRTKQGETGGFEMVHDPHPDETFLDQSESFGWCMFFDE